jgi:hypothetical protein
MLAFLGLVAGEVAPVFFGDSITGKASAYDLVLN